jgi:hypothetical protein
MRRLSLLVLLLAFGLSGCQLSPIRDYAYSGERLLTRGQASYATPPEAPSVACRPTLGYPDCEPLAPAPAKPANPAAAD